MSFIGKLDRTILALGVSALLCATLLLSFVAGTITRPMDNLLAGVRALARGDYAFSITPRGSTEVVELGTAFSKMRGELLDSQRRQIETEQVAALGRAASSISHDLRHSLAAVVANAEFLYEADKLKLDRDEIYEEIKIASEQMTELLDSLRELSREHRTLSLVTISLESVVRRAADAVLTRPEFHNRLLSIQASQDTTGVFDPRKIERAFFNLLLNACEATSDRGKIDIEIKCADQSFEVRLADDGIGIPAGIRSTLFDPFISSGKSNGTGLGLAIVSKILHDHYGSVAVEQTGERGTVFLVKFPRSQNGVGNSLETEIHESNRSPAT
jgi:signal transduction histidine kinase